MPNRQNDSVWIPGARSGGANVAAEFDIARTKFTVIASKAARWIEAIFPLEWNIDLMSTGLDRSGDGGPFQLARRNAGGTAGFFWAVGAPSTCPFLRDPQSKNVSLIQVAYAGIGLGPDKRDIFMRLLRQVHSP